MLKSAHYYKVFFFFPWNRSPSTVLVHFFGHLSKPCCDGGWLVSRFACTEGGRPAGAVHTLARATPCLGNRLGQGAFVDWQDGWVQRLCQPIPLFSFQTWLAISFFLEASEPAPSQFSSFGPLCTHRRPGRSHCVCFRHRVLFHFGFSNLTIP